MNTIGYDELKDRTGCKTPSELAAKLAKDGIKFFRGTRGRPWTTTEALNAALGIKKQPKNDTEIVVNVR